MGIKLLIFSVCFIFSGMCSLAQSDRWELWATGLPQGAYPRMTVAPNHELFFALLGTPVKLGIIFRADTRDDMGKFIELPPVPRPASVQNNIVAIGYNASGEPLAGVYRTDISEPWLFRFDAAAQSWVSCLSDISPTLGGQSIATSASGIIYVSTKWSYVYKSTDDGRTFKVIDETKILASHYPCYYPSILNGAVNNGALFALNIDKNGRIYAGTETSGLIYSDDEGVSWKPADLFACSDGTLAYNPKSPMSPLARSGNVSGIGFTKNNNVVWSGVDMWHYGWKNKLGFADLQDSMVTEVIGLPDYLIQTGQQVSKIVTTESGMMFFHSGSSNGAMQVGIYRSMDGIHWDYFNAGITGANDGLSQGSLAVDGNTVFMATHDGKVWRYKAAEPDYVIPTPDKVNCRLIPNPAYSYFTLTPKVENSTCRLLNSCGMIVAEYDSNETEGKYSLNGISEGVYVMMKFPDGQTAISRLIKLH